MYNIPCYYCFRFILDFIIFWFWNRKKRGQKFSMTSSTGLISKCKPLRNCKDLPINKRRNWSYVLLVGIRLGVSFIATSCRFFKNKINKYNFLKFISVCFFSKNILCSCCSLLLVVHSQDHTYTRTRKTKPFSVSVHYCLFIK